MCGIVGLIDGDKMTVGGDLENRVRRMADTLHHRGPDDAGCWTDPKAGVALGHRRLSILDLSANGHQPMESASGRYVVTYNGEVYNFHDLRTELERLGHRFRGGSDTEVLLATVEQWGLDDALGRCIGMFAFAVWDRAERILRLARDRMGEKPLYYGWSGRSFLFGSELKALRAHPAWRGKVDRGAVALLLRYGYVPAPRSIYAGVFKLPPGTTLTLRPGDAPGVLPSPVPYWSVADMVERGKSEPLRPDPDSVLAELERLLHDAVASQLVADVPVGAFLSGGIDSSLVVALMQAQNATPVKTFSIGFAARDYNEAGHAKAVADYLRTDHTELYVTAPELRELLPRLPAIYDEPIADPSQIPTWLVANLARRHVTVALSGDGGDELFGGYNRYLWGRRIWRSAGRLPTGLRRRLAGGLARIPPSAWDHLSELLAPHHRPRHLGQKVRKLTQVIAMNGADGLSHGLMSHWVDPSALVRCTPESAALVANQAPNRLSDPVERAMYLDSVGYLPDDILVKVDRAAMAVGLETRVPLLDHRVVAFSWRLPLAFKIRNGVGKWALRQVLYRYVPRRLVDRPKTGFDVPLAAWLRGPLRDWAAELLDEGTLQRQGFLEPVVIRKIWNEHLAGVRDQDSQLWSVLVFQAWLRETKAAG